MPMHTGNDAALNGLDNWLEEVGSGDHWHRRGEARLRQAIEEADAEEFESDEKIPSILARFADGEEDPFN